MQCAINNTDIKHKICLSNLLKVITTAILIWQVTGCTSTLYTPSNNNQNSLPIEVSDYRAKKTNYAKVDITTQDVAEGLKQLCTEMEQKIGRFDSESLILDYTPVIKKDVYSKGFSVITHLGINGTDVTIEAYFTVKGMQPAFTIRSYFNNSNQPQFQVTNHYYISQK